jgi:hypothetical protein
MTMAVLMPAAGAMHMRLGMLVAVFVAVVVIVATTRAVHVRRRSGGLHGDADRLAARGRCRLRSMGVAMVVCVTVGMSGG